MEISKTVEIFFMNATFKKTYELTRQTPQSQNQIRWYSSGKYISVKPLLDKCF